jgi:adenylosuccinate lyase
MIERYETQAMREVWSDEARFQRWTRIEIAACEAWHARGEIPSDEMHTLRTQTRTPSAARVLEIEQTTQHDVVAFVRALTESVSQEAGRHVHKGLTSSDVVDTALAMALRDALHVLLQAVHTLQEALKKQALLYKKQPCVGRTHGIHAEPTTWGLRLAGWVTELERNKQRLQNAVEEISYAKLSGAVGTFSQTDPSFEEHVLNALDLHAEPVATQVVPRDRHAMVFAVLATLGASLERFATEVRALQRTDIREVEEPFREGQTGSSAMPHKRNPITCERITGMARLLRGYAVAGFENVALWHDRDISHSSVERVAFPDAFHAAHYMLMQFTRVVEGMRVYTHAMEENLDKTKGLVFSQSVLGVLLRKGMHRTTAYAVVQKAAMQVWEKQHPHFKDALWAQEDVRACMDEATLQNAFSLEPYLKHIDTLFKRANITEG